MSTVAEHYAPHAAPPTPSGLRRYLLGPGWLRAAWMACLFWGIGLGIVLVLRWWGGWDPLFKWSVITVVSTLTAAPIGFLGGLGAFDYWVKWAIGSPTTPEDHSSHGGRTWTDYFRPNTDHKVIGIQYLVTTIVRRVTSASKPRPVASMSIR